VKSTKSTKREHNVKIAFMGTPEFAVKSLERLYNDGHDITGVVTQPDRPRNRGMKLSFSPVKELAIKYGLSVYQPTSLKNNEFTTLVNSFKCDLLVVVAYGRIIPEEILDIPVFGTINIHGSLLPKYRGAAPVQWAIMNGETKTGVTSQFVAPEVDAGDIIFSRETVIGDDETAGELYDRLSILGAELLSDTVRAFESGQVVRISQDASQATFAPLITKDMIPIDWNKTAIEIKNLVRGLAPKPAATANIDGSIVKVFRVETGDKTNAQNVLHGEVVSKGNFGIEVACSDGTIIIKELQAPGGKRMGAADFLRGRMV